MGLGRDSLAIRIAWLFSPVALLILAIAAWITGDHWQVQLRQLQNAQEMAVARAATQLEKEVNETANDVLMLALSPDTIDYMDHLGAPANQHAVEGHLLALSAAKRRYDQIRLLDLQGMERIRVDYKDGQTRLVPTAELQNKVNRYYFSEAVSLPPGQLYLSPLDLNVERGQVEQPLKPMLRVATSLFDGQGERLGVVVINLLAGPILDTVFHQADNPGAGTIMLVDGNREFLHHPDSKLEWGTQLGHGTRFDENIWAGVRPLESGYVMGAGGGYAVHQAHPLQQPGRPEQAGDRQWWVISHVDQGVIDALQRQIVLPKLALALLALITWFLASFSIARAMHRQQAAERAALAKSEALENANRELKQAEAQLLQSEKMASIGQLAAGVAHEINNPIAFISSNLGTLDQQTRGLLQVVAAYREAEPQLAAEARERIDAAKRAAELDFIEADIGDLIEESMDGARRVRKIVEDLKDFARADGGEWCHADLERGLDSTLNIVRNEIKYKAQVLKEYAGLPEIECIPGQLNQVFMNLIVNGAHAIEGQGQLVLRTGYDAEQVWVEVEDTGPGVPAGLRQRIFEPFFTTKPVGQGTGLGLSVAYSIVHRHQGRIEVHDAPGGGALFRITLPRRQPAAKDATPSATTVGTDATPNPGAAAGP